MTLFFVYQKTNAQITLNGSTTFCIDKLAVFTYKEPVGKTVKTYDWDFGNSYTSKDTIAQHLFKTAGTYTVKIKATFTDNTTETKSLNVIVKGLPKAIFTILPNSTYCKFDTNYVYFKDLSEKASPGQDIVSRVAVWDDGKSNLYNTPKKNDILDHYYTAPNTYKVRFEITDNFGCKAEENKTVIIKRSILIDSLEKFDSYTSCSQARLCYYSVIKKHSSSGNSYKWLVDNQQKSTLEHAPGNNFCVNIIKSGITKTLLIATSIDGCKDTIESNVSFDFDTNFTLKINKKTICYGAREPLVVSTKNGRIFDALNYSVSNILVPHDLCPTKCKTDTVRILPKLLGILPGKHSLKVRFQKGNCIFFKYIDFEVIGPVAQAKIINDQQCLVQRPVYFFANGKYATKNTKFKWIIEDINGYICVEDKNKKTNFNKNCNIIYGYYGKHIYKIPREYNDIKLIVTDTVTGCLDSIVQNVNLKYCGFYFPFEPVELCRSQVFYQYTNVYGKPQKFSLDSGKTWKLFPNKINKEPGTYDVCFIYKTDAECWVKDYTIDSMDLIRKKITYLDTICVDSFLVVKSGTKDTFALKYNFYCDSTELLVSREGDTFRQGETFTIDWGDGGRVDLTFSKDTVIKGFKHMYYGEEIGYKLLIIVKNANGCFKGIFKDIILGTKKRIIRDDSLCLNNKICFNAEIRDNQTLQDWTDSSNFGNFRWKIDGKIVRTNKFKYCHTFNKIGKYTISLETTDINGCTTSYDEDIIIQKVLANVTDESRKFFCSDIRKFFDSSMLQFPNPNDSICKYSWSFSNDKIISYIKNPVKVLNKHDKITRVKHIAESYLGCKDSIEFDIIVLKTQPYFNIKDSIGCSVFKADFINNSRLSDTYIWEFGDENNTIQKMSTKQNVSFSYTKPGRYYVSLIGVDTFYNPITKNTYYCTSRFPREGQYKDTTRSILVLPTLKTSFNTKDSICLGDTIFLESTSDSGFQYDHWSFGNGQTLKTRLDTSFYIVYQNNGEYKINLTPYYPIQAGYPNCLQKDSQLVFVNSVNADFSIDPNSDAPIFFFINNSSPSNANLWWDFGHPESGSKNNSTEQDPSHNFGQNTKTYNICLYAQVPPGCRDSTCKTIYNDYFQNLRVYNVYSPDNNDGFNDEYDVRIKGEDLYDLKIYNRWNQLVFESDTDAENGENINWNGHLFNTGTKCPAGTYYYVFRYSYKIDPENIKTIKGSVTLLRKEGK